jgi:uncharacterized protein
MSEQAAQEPTMEEILASIRRIISEDEAPAAPEAGSAPEAPVVAEAPPPAAPVVEEEDVLELTNKLSEPEAIETHGDLDVLPLAPSAPPPPVEPETVLSAPAHDDALLSPPAAAAAAMAFGQLSKTVMMPAEGRTLEDVVREMLRPMLKAWLDEHLPGIVQAAVTEEVERVSRRRV